MQIPMMCLDCLKDRQIGRLVYAVVDLDDDGRLAGECEQGHAVRYATPRPNHDGVDPEPSDSAAKRFGHAKRRVGATLAPL